jgi:hypothetical protein
LPGSRESILAAQNAIDLLRCEARELFRRGAGTEQAQRCNLAGLSLCPIKAAVGVLGVEHGENASDPIARQAEFLWLILVITMVILIRRNADHQHFAHRRVSELIVQPGRDPFRLRDPGDGPAGQLVQPAPAGDSVFGSKRLGAEHEGHKLK